MCVCVCVLETWSLMSVTHHLEIDAKTSAGYCTISSGTWVMPIQFLVLNMC